jgi:glycosyltransferase involved in cell wall biosynthesis
MLSAIHQIGVASQVRILGLIPREDQIQLVRASMGIVHPSLFEGWSTVVEDSRLFGKPIILSNIPVHREQNPELGRYFEPHSSEDLADAINRLWLDGKPGPQLLAESEGRLQSINAAHRMAKTFLSIATQ